MFRCDTVLFDVIFAGEEVESDCVQFLTRVVVVGGFGGESFGNDNVVYELGEGKSSTFLAEGVEGFLRDIGEDWEVHRGSFDILRCGHDDFTKTRNSKSNVSSSVSCTDGKMSEIVVQNNEAGRQNKPAKWKVLRVI